MELLHKKITKFSIICNDKSDKFEKILRNELINIDILKCTNLEFSNINDIILPCLSNYIGLQIDFDDIEINYSKINISDLFRSFRISYVFIIWNTNLSNANEKLQYLGRNWPIEIRPIFIDSMLLELYDSTNACKEMIQRSLRLARIAPTTTATTITTSLLTSDKWNNNVHTNGDDESKKSNAIVCGNEQVSEFFVKSSKIDLLNIEDVFHKAEFDSFDLPLSTLDVMPLREPPEPINGWKYRVAAPYLNEESKSNVLTAIETKSVSSASYWVKQMADLLSHIYVTMPVVQPCCNGYNSIVLVLQAAKVGKGDAVLIPAFTMIAVSNAVEQVGALCIYVDNEKDQYNPSIRTYLEAVKIFHASYVEPNVTSDKYIETPKQLQKKPIIKGLIVCHTYGVPAEDIEGIADLCKDNHWLLMEDISECVGVRVALKNTHSDNTTTQPPSSQLLGTFGDYACASLYANKIVHGGDAGFVLAKDIKIEYYLKSIVNHGFTGSFHFLHFVSAVNAKINGLGAALACASLSSMDTVLHNRSYIADYYRKRLSHLVDAGYIASLMPRCGVDDTPWVFGVHTHDKQTRDSIREYLAIFGIETRNYFFPNNLQPCFKTHFQAKSHLTHAEYTSKTGFYIPTYYDLTEQDLGFICSCISSYFISNPNYNRNQISSPSSVVEVVTISSSYINVDNNNTDQNNNESLNTNIDSSTS